MLGASHSGFRPELWLWLKTRTTAFQGARFFDRDGLGRPSYKPCRCVLRQSLVLDPAGVVAADAEELLAFFHYARDVGDLGR